MFVTLNTENVDPDGNGLEQRTSTFYTPWMPRGGDYVLFGVEVIAMSKTINDGASQRQSAPQLDVTVQTKPTTVNDDPGGISSGTPVSLTAEGNATASYNDPLELVRLKFEFTDVVGQDQLARVMYVTFRALNPSWAAN